MRPILAPAVAVVAVAFAACNGQQRNPVAACTTSATLSANNFGPAGGSASLQITTRTNCTWSLTADGWIVPERKTGEGPATIALAVAPNGEGAARSGAITVGEQRLAVSQGGCSVSIGGMLPDFSAAGGAATLTLDTTPACRWTAQIADTWAAVSPTSGEGPTSLSVTVVANPAVALRTTALVVNGQSTTVRQSPLPCQYRIDPPDVLARHEGHHGTLTIDTAPGCTWAVFPNGDWILFRSPTTGTGPTTLAFDIPPTPSTTSERQSTVSIQGAGQDVRFRQLSRCGIMFTEPRPGGARIPATVTVSPLGENVKYWALTEPWRCNWNAQTDVSWITVAWPQHPSVQGGDGDLWFSVQPNNTGVERRGRIATADFTLTVIQPSR